jgi:hypothetical protein
MRYSFRRSFGAPTLRPAAAFWMQGHVRPRAPMIEPACLDDQMNDVFMALEVARPLGFVLAREPRVASDGRGEDGRKEPLVCVPGYRLFGHLCFLP